MGSRYVGQLGRHVGQPTKELAYIQTCEVAMWASQGLMHSRLRSLCVHPFRYIPSGACCSSFTASVSRLTASAAFFAALVTWELAHD